MRCCFFAINRQRKDTAVETENWADLQSIYWFATFMDALEQILTNLQGVPALVADNRTAQHLERTIQALILGNIQFSAASEDWEINLNEMERNCQGCSGLPFRGLMAQYDKRTRRCLVVMIMFVWKAVQKKGGRAVKQHAEMTGSHFGPWLINEVEAIHREYPDLGPAALRYCTCTVCPPDPRHRGFFNLIAMHFRLFE